MARELRNLDWIISKNMFNRLVYGNETNFFLVDTGTIIDIEDFYHNNGMEPEYFPVTVLSDIERTLSDINKDNSIIITPGVWEEVKRKKESRKNIRHEISPPTVQLIKQFYDDSKEKTDEILDNCKFRDENRYLSTLAAHETFRKDYRKGEKDRISVTDIELISHALDFVNENYNKKPISVVNILTTDSHISETINTIKKKEIDDFLEYNIHPDPNSLGSGLVRAMHTRGDLRSYLLK